MIPPIGQGGKPYGLGLVKGKPTNSVALCTRLATVDHHHAGAVLPPARVRIPAANQSELRAAFGEGPAQNGGEWAQTRTLYQVASGARSPYGSRQKCPARRLSRKAGQFGRAFGMYDMAVDAILIFGFPVGVFVGYMLRDQISRARHGRYDPYLQ